MKKLFLCVVFFFSFFTFQDVIANSLAGCSFQGDGDVGAALTDCIRTTDVVVKDDLKAGSGLKNILYGLSKLIGGILGVVAVGALVYASFIMVVSQGEEEKVSKAKDIIKWTLIGFLGVVSAGALITIVVNIIYDLGG